MPETLSATKSRRSTSLNEMIALEIRAFLKSNRRLRILRTKTINALYTQLKDNPTGELAIQILKLISDVGVNNARGVSSLIGVLQKTDPSNTTTGAPIEDEKTDEELLKEIE